MGMDLYRTSQVFRDSLDAFDRVWKPISGWSIMEDIINGGKQDQILIIPLIAQGCAVGLQYALTMLFRAIGITASSYTGTSTGEVLAAHLSGILSLRDALSILYHRSNIQMKTFPNGRSILVLAKQDIIQSILDNHKIEAFFFDIGHKSSLMSGRIDMVERLADTLKETYGISCHLIPYKTGNHCYLLDPFKESFFQDYPKIQDGVSPPTTGYFSSTIGQEITPTNYQQVGSADFWWSNTRQPIHLYKTWELMMNASDCTIEIAAAHLFVNGCDVDFQQLLYSQPM
eukprot:gene14503-17117_t